MLWKIYTVVFFVINAVSLVAFDYSYFDYVGFLSLILGVGLNIAVYSYAFKKPIFSKVVLNWLFKLNVAMYGVFALFEVVSFLQEIFGAGINLPTSGMVSIIASFPALPALYATYKLAYLKSQKPRSKKKSRI